MDTRQIAQPNDEIHTEAKTKKTLNGTYKQYNNEILCVQELTYTYNHSQRQRLNWNCFGDLIKWNHEWKRLGNDSRKQLFTIYNVYLAQI